MPEYGLLKPSSNSDPETEDMEDLKLNIKQWEQAEREKRQRYEAAQTATLETAALIRQLNERLNLEHPERLKSEKINARFQWANLILVALTLVATIIFGINSCIDVSTGDAQESKSVITNSASVQPS